MQSKFLIVSLVWVFTWKRRSFFICFHFL